MKSSPQSRFIVTLVMFMVIGLFIGGLMIETQYKPLIIVFFGWGIFAAYLLRRIRCPSCEMPVIYQGKILGISIYGGICRQKCANCGRDLTKPSA
jgi:DNA-directed RNA polymerase subunit RPC12/RpoP